MLLGDPPSAVPWRGSGARAAQQSYGIDFCLGGLKAARELRASLRKARADRWDLAERSAHVGFELAALAWLDASYLRLCAGALGEELGQAHLGLLGLERHDGEMQISQS